MDWAVVAATKKKPAAAANAPAHIQDTTTSWSQAAGRKAGGGTVQSVGRTPATQSKKANNKAKQASIDPAVVQQAALRRIAVEALEHAMDSKDLALITAAIAQHRGDAQDTDALWRANAMAKEAGIPVNLFKEKSRDFRSRHH